MSCLLLLAILPRTDVVTVQVDVIERNVVGQFGQFEQYIFWDLAPPDAEPAYHCVAWRRAAICGPVSRSSRQVLRWRERGLQMVVSSRCYVETHTDYDPEVANRKFLAMDKRRGLQ